MKDKEALASNIKALLKERDIKQTQLAEALEISNGTLSDWLRGRFYPRQKYITAIAEFFGVEETEITKEVFQLRLNGYSYFEISEKLNISENSARVIFFRVKTKIKKYLEKEGFYYD